jgi:hypothetical protein
MKMDDFITGETLKLNQEGLHHWTGGDKKAMERCAKWRFIVKRRRQEPNVVHPGQIIEVVDVERIGLRSHKMETWNVRFLE